MSSSAIEPPAWLVESVREVPDFPEPGILFRDLSPLWASSSASARCAVAMAAGAGPVDVVVGIEARGFLVGMLVAPRLGVGFVPIRKPGKLPGQVVSIEYALEYGNDGLELQVDAIGPGSRVMLVDDVLATGGTMAAAASLVEQFDADVVAIRTVIELRALDGRSRLPDTDIRCLWEID